MEKNVLFKVRYHNKIHNKMLILNKKTLIKYLNVVHKKFGNN